MNPLCTPLAGLARGVYATGDLRFVLAINLQFHKALPAVLNLPEVLVNSNDHIVVRRRLGQTTGRQHPEAKDE